MKLRVLLNRLKSARLKRLYKQFSLQAVDELLYSINTNESNFLINEEIIIERLTHNQNTGIERIDNRSGPLRECYLARIKGEIAHESWLFYDVLLPGQFGFDADVPVIGDCLTYTAYRGRNIYPHVLRYIAADLEKRKVCKKVFILVSPDNKPSIRGIERAGFYLLARIQGKKILGFLLNKNIVRTPANSF
jgi:hypothetical protein